MPNDGKVVPFKAAADQAMRAPTASSALTSATSSLLASGSNPPTRW